MRPVVALAVSAFLTTSPARAELWLDGRGAVGILGGSYEYEKPYANGAESGVLHDSTGVVAVPISLQGRAGLGITRQIGVGLLGRAELAPYAPTVPLQYSSLMGHVLFGAGPTLVMRPHGAIEVAGSVEWTYASFWGSSIDIGAPDNVFEFEGVYGPSASLSLGCCAEPGFRFGMEGRAGYLTSPHTTFVPVSFALYAGASTW